MAGETSFFFTDAAGELTPAPDAARTSAPRQAWSAPPTLATAIGVRDETTRERLARALRRAVEEQTRSVIMIGTEPADRRMVTIRPAREPGHAVVACVELGAGLAQLQPGDVVELFSLSPAEAEIAILLTQGSSLSDVAAHRGVQQETVRGQVKVLLRKMGVANQKQLAAMLAQVGAALMALHPAEPRPARA